MRVLSPIFAPAQVSPIGILNTRDANTLPKPHHYHLTSRAAAPGTKTAPPPNSLKAVRWWQTHPQLLQAAQKHFSLLHTIQRHRSASTSVLINFYASESFFTRMPAAARALPRASNAKGTPFAASPVCGNAEVREAKA